MRNKINYSHSKEVRPFRLPRSDLRIALVDKKNPSRIFILRWVLYFSNFLDFFQALLMPLVF